MTVTIIGINTLLEKTDKFEGVDYDLVTIKEIHKKNGKTRIEVRIKNGKRDIVLGDGYYSTITVQEETTGRYLLKHNR